MPPDRRARRTARGCRDAARAQSRTIAVEFGDVRTAGDDEFDIGRKQGQCPNGIVDALARHHPAEDDEPPARLGRFVLGLERLEIDAGGDDVDPLPRRADLDQLSDLVGARGDDPVDVAAQLPFVVLTFGGAAVRAPLMALLDRAQRVEGLHDRDVQRCGGPGRHQPAHPEVSVEDVGWIIAQPGGQVVGHCRNERQQLVLGDRPRRSSVQMHNVHAGAHRDPGRQRRRVAPRVHNDVVAAIGQRTGEGRDVHVLAARVDAAECGERAGVLGDHRDFHESRSSNSSSQSARNRGSP
jgi:hypothetical protein